MIEVDQIRFELKDAHDSLEDLGAALDLESLRQSLDELNTTSEQPGFWDEHERATKLLKEKKRLENKIALYDDLNSDLEELEIMLDLAEEEDDASLAEESQIAYRRWTKRLEDAKLATLLDGPYDSNNAIVTVHAGSGGTDAQDWAEMLLRMYTRYAEKHGYKVKIYDFQDLGDGGIKSATFLVEGENAYGYLKNEKGVHRIVRISPFDSQARRHTAFSSVDVMPEIDEDINVDIASEDIRIDTFRASGAGGQHINKTDSAVRITHLPTNIVVSCQNERSQHQNKETAMKVLMSKLIELKEEEHKESLAELAGDYSQITWGSQIRSYVFHPYSMVKDHRTDAETGNVNAVMDGDLDLFINEKLKQR
ncbi:MAG: peptide chain release factor 2 [Clostridiales Family XIII bacterium]|jgi:peptide chain release factor 2|nr:peptide chain release factor 2 [Clostridiales Family XIII bacterium]